MMIEPLNPLPLQSSAQKPTIEGASQQFEALIFRQFLEKALKPVFKSNLLGESNATDTYRSFFVDSLSQSIASTQPLKLNQYLKSVDHEK